MIFPVGNGPGAGRVLSVFNASCRLAVVFERVMDCRTEFRSSAQRAAAVTAIDEICLRWKTMLPDALRFNEHSDSPMNVAAIHSLYHSSAFFLLRDGLNAQTFNAAAWCCSTSAPRRMRSKPSSPTTQASGVSWKRQPNGPRWSPMSVVGCSTMSRQLFRSRKRVLTVAVWRSRTHAFFPAAGFPHSSMPPSTT